MAEENGEDGDDGDPDRYLEALITGGANPLLEVFSKYLPRNVSAIIVEYSPSAIMGLVRALAKAPSRGALPPRPAVPEALLFLHAVKEAQHFYTPKKRKKKKKRNAGAAPPGAPPKTRGWGFGTLYGALKGSRSEKVRKCGVTTALGWGRHLPEAFWKRMCLLLDKKRYLAGKFMSMGSFGPGGYVYTLGSKGEEVSTFTGTCRRRRVKLW
uniref:Uncharacterized protein n=1 Tax=Lotharella oceanica TaxID=641309 RepID=A0A7S2THC1_9EUKA